MNDRLRSALNRLAAEAANTEPPPRVEAALVAEFRRHKRRKARWAWSLAAVAAAATVLVLWIPQQPQQVAELHPVSAPAEAPQDAEQPFVALPYITPPAPYEQIQVVRMQVPVTALIAAGLPMQGADPGGRVDAEVVLGQDGRARAVRFVHSSRFN